MDTKCNELDVQLLSSKYDDNECDDGSLNADVKFKVIVLGSRKVGKRTLLSYINQISPVLPMNVSSFVGNVSTSASMSIDYSQLKFKVNHDKVITLKIWSSNGLEKNVSLTKNYYNDTNIVLLMYDVTNKASYESIQSSYRSVKDKFDGNTNYVIVGNKSDSARKEVNFDKVKGYAKANGISDAFEISAKNGNGVSTLFEKVVHVAYNQYQLFSNMCNAVTTGSTGNGNHNGESDSSIDITQEIGDDYIKEIKKINKRKCCYLC